MGRRSRRRRQEDAAPVSTTDYADPDGNILTLRDEVSPGTVRQIRELDSTPAASGEDRWQRRGELLFERLAVRWTIHDLPLEGQKELLGRYRMTDTDMRRWVRDTIDGHVREHQPDLAES